jgi:flagellar biogenesis protein FliO
MAASSLARSPRRLSPKWLGIGVIVVALGVAAPRMLMPGADNAPTDGATSSEPFALGPAVARLAGCMVLVCGLCIVATRFINRKADVAQSSMQTLASIRINARCVVHLVQAGERRLLLGTDGGGVKALVELPPMPPVDTDVIPVNRATDLASRAA